jgi:hypothetical protein
MHDLEGGRSVATRRDSDAATMIMEMPARALLGATVRVPPWSILVERDVHYRLGTWHRAAIGALNWMAGNLGSRDAHHSAKSS